MEYSVALKSLPYKFSKISIEIFNFSLLEYHSIPLNSKLLIGTTSRLWRTQGYSGYYFSDLAAQTGWDNAQLQNGNTGAGGITVFGGGNEGVLQGTGTPDFQAARYATDLNKIFPGFNAILSNKNARMHWPSYEFTKGSYAAYKVGQYQTIAGREAEPIGNILFAGEHTSLDFQGYMNGGAETGKRAATEVVALLKKK